MDYKELLKKYWFVLLVGVALIVFVVVWAVDNNANNTKAIQSQIQTKEVDGKYILFEIDGNAYTADEYYELIDTSSSISLALEDLLAYFANKEIKATEEIKTLATNNAQYYIVNTTPDQLEQMMRAYGLKKYGNITNFYEELFKKEELKKQYLLKHSEEIIKPYIGEQEYKKVSHILIKVADVTESTDENGNTIHTANPTEEETQKLQDALKMLEKNSFAETAKKYSEDGSATLGGFLACCTDEQASSTYVKEFADTVAMLSFGEQSEVITTQYGYHIILVEEPSDEDLLDDDNILSALITNDISNENYIKLLIEYSDKYNVEIVDDEIIELFDNYRPASEDTTETSETTESEESK